MSFQRKLRKLVLHPVAFFRDSKLFNSKNLPPKDIATNTNDIFAAIGVQKATKPLEKAA